MPSSLRPRNAPTASVKRCSRFQRRPSGSRTGRFANRWHGSSVITRPSKRPQTTRPLEAPKSMAANCTGWAAAPPDPPALVKVEHLFDPLERELALEERRHLRLPPCVHVSLLHHTLSGLEVLGLEVPDQEAVGAQEQRVVRPARRAERREHLRPHGPVTLAVLVEAVHAHLDVEADAFHGARAF